MPISPPSRPCCDDLPQVDEVWALGDIVGYGPQPNEVIAASRSWAPAAVMGNHDGAAIGTGGCLVVQPRCRTRAIALDRPRSSTTTRAPTWPALPEVRRDGELTAVHGSPRDPIWEYITGRRRRERQPVALRDAHLPHGHTHLPVDLPRRRDPHGRSIPATPGRAGHPRRATRAASTRAASASRATAIPRLVPGARHGGRPRRVPSGSLRDRRHPAPDARGGPAALARRAALDRALRGERSAVGYRSHDLRPHARSAHPSSPTTASWCRWPAPRPMTQRCA